MNTGKMVFAQLMDFLPWSTFGRIVARYDGDRAVRTLSCAEQYRVMAFAQLTYRESLRDIEVNRKRSSDTRLQRLPSKWLLCPRQRGFELSLCLTLMMTRRVNIVGWRF
jgi:hypothetical protein